MTKNSLALALLAAALIAAGPADAQYQWRDNSGQMVFSDKPPPADVKPSQIIRAQPLPNYPAAAAPAPSAATPSLADQQMQEREKAQAKAAEERKKHDEAERTARLAQACEQMRSELRTLDSGMRVASVNAAGEREYMSDDDRAKRTTELKKNLQDNCTAG